jgi:Protein of Unknown function (DUF2784)
MVWPRVIADLIVALHACYVAFLVLGLAAILVGTVCRWRWVRNIYFRIIHLAMIAVVVAEAMAGVPCPLTVWEKQLRVLAGQATYPGDFLGYWVHRLLFYRAEPWVFTLVYVTFGLAVIVALVLAPPQLPATGATNVDGRPEQPAR